MGGRTSRRAYRATVKAALGFLLFTCCALPALYTSGFFPYSLGLTAGSHDSVNVEPCDCLADPELEIQSNLGMWLPSKASPQCRERCASIRNRCELCDNLDGPGQGERTVDCGPMCRVHGWCPKRMTRQPEKLFSCPPYDPATNRDRLSVLERLGAEVKQSGEHPGIEVHGIVLGRSPWDTSNRELWCAIRYLVYDHLVVVFKGQDSYDQCASDYQMCDAVADFNAATNAGGLGTLNTKVSLLSNHPLLGMNNLLAGNWHYDGTGETCLVGMFTVQESTGSYGRTGFVRTGSLLRDMSPQERDRWQRTSWRSIHLLPWENGHLPAINTHTVKHEQVLLLSLNVNLTRDYGQPSQVMLGDEENKAVLDSLDNMLMHSKYAFNVTWSKGEVAFVDNIALLHKVLPDSFRRVDEVGVRVLRKSLCGCYMKPAAKERRLQGMNLRSYSAFRGWP
eukprot:jgi/Mesvir1/27234/Mv07077-RA.1